jgi:membrane protease YdiL (CAAX protease family)
MNARSVFIGPSELRAGWRLLIFAAIFVPLTYGANFMADAILGRLHMATDMGPETFIVWYIFFLVPLFLATGIMAKIEHRTFADYGLPWRRAFCGQFWQGVAIALGSITVFLFALHLGGVFSFGSLALQGADIWKYGIGWSVTWFLGALLEDFLYRGYLLFTLTTGVGFWPAAVVTSLIMGGTHYLHPGGHGLGPPITFVYCMVTCLVIRRTGDLWMALGIHAAWDWAAIFLYGIPSGGGIGQGRLLNSSFHGPDWATGGQYGPEASWPNLLLLVIWAIFFSVWLSGVKYPNPAGVERAARG